MRRVFDIVPGETMKQRVSIPLHLDVQLMTKEIRMKQLILAMLCVAFLATLPGNAMCDEAAGQRSGEVKALLLLCNSYGANYNLIRDVMEQYGWDITTIGVTPTVTKCFWGENLTVDTLVSQISDVSQFDCLVIMQARAYTGDSHSQLLESPEAIAMVADAVDAGILVAAFCGGARVLAAADVVNGLTITGHPLYEQEYLDAGATFVEGPVPPIVDGNILTSRRGQYYCYRICEVMRTTIDNIRAAGTP